MSDFQVGADLTLSTDRSSLRDVRSEIESELSDIPVGVEADLGPRGSGGAGAEAGGRERRRRRREFRWARERTEFAEQTVALLESIEDSVGEGGGGGLLGTLGGGGAAGVAAGGLSLGGLATGGLAAGGAGIVGAGTATFLDAGQTERAARVGTGQFIGESATIEAAEQVDRMGLDTVGTAVGGVLEAEIRDATEGVQLPEFPEPPQPPELPEFPEFPDPPTPQELFGEPLNLTPQDLPLAGPINFSPDDLVQGGVTITADDIISGDGVDLEQVIRDSIDLSAQFVADVYLGGIDVSAAANTIQGAIQDAVEDETSDMERRLEREFRGGAP
jgi:hypothetical protein